MNKATFVRTAEVAGMWLPAILLILIFARQGWAKFNDTSGWAVAFRHWGYPDWFRVTIGVLELSAVLLLALGRTAAYGAIIIIVVMLGAMGTHVYWGRPNQVTSEILPLFLASMVALGRRKSFFLHRRQVAVS